MQRMLDLRLSNRQTVWPPAARYLAVVIAVALATLLLTPFRSRLGLLNVGLLYLLLVVVLSARWGWGPGLFASVVANLAFNFFFVPPLHHFTVEAPSNILALLIFLGVASLTSALLTRARAGEAAARRREQETVILYELSRLIITNPDAAMTLRTILQRVRETFGVVYCAVLLPGENGLQPSTWEGPPDAVPATGYERSAAAEAFAGGRTVTLGSGAGRRRPRIVGMRDRKGPVMFVPLRIGGAVVGVLEVVGRLDTRVFTADEGRLLEAFADEAALAVDRDRLVEEAARVQALQEADQLKSALMSAVSHDLRTPLTTILASVSSLLQSDVEWDAQTRDQFLVQIEQQALRLNRLVGNLLDVSRIEGGALHPDKDWYDVGEFLETAVAGLEPISDGHVIVLDVAPDAGDAPFDHVQMTQVVANLVENAIKFSPKGADIRIGAHRVGGEVVISVADQGPGIPPPERERVFEKFYRVKREGAGVRGSGLGLAICKGLVEANGGRIRVEQTPGGGARFVVTLPAPAPPPSALVAHEVRAR
jgi:two-component system, OmpR family, sensor histidine kinase KdpD